MRDNTNEENAALVALGGIKGIEMPDAQMFDMFRLISEKSHGFKGVEIDAMVETLENGKEELVIRFWPQHTASSLWTSPDRTPQLAAAFKQVPNISAVHIEHNVRRTNDSQAQSAYLAKFSQFAMTPNLESVNWVLGKLTKILQG